MSADDVRGKAVRRFAEVLQGVTRSMRGAGGADQATDAGTARETLNRAHLASVLAARPRSPLYACYAQALLREERPVEAEAVLAAGLAIFPNHATGLLLRARALAMLRRYRDARGTLHQLLALQPGNIGATRLLERMVALELAYPPAGAVPQELPGHVPSNSTSNESGPVAVPALPVPDRFSRGAVTNDEIPEEGQNQRTAGAVGGDGMQEPANAVSIAPPAATPESGQIEKPPIAKASPVHEVVPSRDTEPIGNAGDSVSQPASGLDLTALALRLEGARIPRPEEDVSDAWIGMEGGETERDGAGVMSGEGSNPVTDMGSRPVTATLISIYEQQGRYATAAAACRRFAEMHPGRKEEFLRRAEELDVRARPEYPAADHSHSV